MPAYIFNPLPPGEFGAHLDRDEYMSHYNTTLNSKWFHVQVSAQCATVQNVSCVKKLCHKDVRFHFHA